MAEPYLLGRNAKIYFNQNAQKIRDVGTGPDLNTYITEWLNDSNTIVAGNVMDVTLNVGSEFADATTREVAQEGFASEVPVLKGGEVTFDVRWKPTDPAVTPPPYSFIDLLRNTWESDGQMGLVFLDQDRANPGVGNSVAPQGLAANWAVSFDKEEALRDIQKASVSVRISDSAKWYSEVITGS